MLRGARGAIAALACALAPVQGAQAATVVFDDDTGTAAWHHAGNWSGNVVPGAGDDVVVPQFLTVELTIDAQVRSLSLQGGVGAGGLMADGATLTVGGAGPSSLGGPIVLDGAGAVLLGGATTWSGGTWTGDGSGTILNSGSLTITAEAAGGAGAPTVTIDNAGTIAYAGGGLLSIGGAGNPLTAQPGSSVSATQAGGTLQVNAVAGAGTWTTAVGATLSLGGGALGSGASVTAAGTLRVAGSLSVPAGASWAVTGTTTLAGGTLSLAADATTGRLAGAGGGLAVAGTLTSTGHAGTNQFTPAQTTVSGPGRVVLADNGVNATDTLVEGAVALASGAVLTLRGTIAWSAGLLGGDGSGEVVNEGSLAAGASAGGASTPLANAGTLTWNGSPASLGAVRNTGTVTAASGTLTLAQALRGGSSGAWTAAAGATLRFAGGGTPGPGGTVGGAGAIDVAGGTLRFPAGTAYGPAGATRTSGGMLELAGAAVTDRLELAGGGRGGAGTLTVTGAGGQSGVTAPSSLTGGTTLISDGGAVTDLSIAAGLDFTGGALLDVAGPASWSAGELSGDGTGALRSADALAAGPGAQDSPEAVIVNRGAMTVDGSLLLGGAPGSSLANEGEAAVVRALGGVLTVAAPLALGSSGDWRPAAGAEIRFAGGGAPAAGADLRGDGTIGVSAGTLTLGPGVALSPAALSLTGGTLALDTAATPDSYSQAGGTLSGTGTLTTNDFSWSAGTMGGLGATVVEPGGAVSLSGTPSLARRLVLDRDLAPAGPLSLQVAAGGLLDLAAGRALNFASGAGASGAGLVRIGSGAALTAAAGLPAVRVEPGGVLAGTPVVGGGLDNGGIVRPGAPAGVLRAASYTGSGTLELQVAAGGHDVLAVDGDAALGAATVAIERVAGFSPPADATLDLLTAGGVVAGVPAVTGPLGVDVRRVLTLSVLNGQLPAPPGRVRMASLIAPEVSVADVTVAEGAGSAAVPVALDRPYGQPVTVDWTGGGRSGTSTIPAGATAGSIVLPVTGDTLDEPDRAVPVTIAAPRDTSAQTAPDPVLGRAQATLTITDDDDAPAPEPAAPIPGPGPTPAPPQVSGPAVAPATASAPAPRRGISFVATRRSGRVLQRAAGGSPAVLGPARELALGSVVDARAGRVAITVEGPGGRRDTLEAAGAVFAVAQRGAGDPVTLLTMRAPARPRCAPARLSVDARAGRVRTATPHGSATGARAAWVAEVRCTSTRVRVTRGAVAVTLAGGRAATVRAPRSRVLRRGR